MREYQLEGLNWMLDMHARNLNGILADEMGLGKTLQSISLLGTLSLAHGETRPHLVVVPLTVLGNWCRELARWCPRLKVVRMHGNREEREVLKASLLTDRYHVCVTTYETIAQETATFRKVSWCVLVVDEAHRLKNEASLLATKLRMISTARRLLLTGTPIQNNLHELWALLNFLFPEIFTDSAEFDDVDVRGGGKVDDSLPTISPQSPHTLPTISPRSPHNLPVISP